MSSTKNKTVDVSDSALAPIGQTKQAVIHLASKPLW
jgi:hypothetical protein